MGINPLGVMEYLGIEAEAKRYGVIPGVGDGTKQ